MDFELRPNKALETETPLVKTKRFQKKKKEEEQYVPDCITKEWEIYQLILDCTNMLYDEDFRNGASISFTSDEIKKYYTYIYHQSVNSFSENTLSILTTEKFDEVYGVDILKILLLYSKGVFCEEYEGEYDEECRWYILPEFLDTLCKEYAYCKSLYGPNFDKPWINNI